MGTVAQARNTDGLTPGQILQVRHHLDEVLASPAFAGSKRARDFLQLIVGHALKGDFDSLRERMIGAEMFGRPIGYDTGSDSVVRVKATEVRKKLAQYYRESASPTLRIELPSGSYVPRFCFESAETLEHDEIGSISPVAPRRGVERRQEQSTVTEADLSKRMPDKRDVLRPLSMWRRPAHTQNVGLGLWIGSALLALAALISGKRWYLHSNAASSIHSVAILPLRNFSGVPAQEYFADGMTQELVSDLGQVSTLHVAPIASVMRYKGTSKTEPEIARELAVDGVVEGSVQREGNQVLISVQLTDGKTNHPVWAHTYVRDLATALAWQGEVAQTIVKEIDLGVTQQSQARFRRNRPIDPVAQDLYTHGKYLLEAEDCTNGADYFRAALNVSFNYPQAQAALAFCDGHLGESDRMDSNDAFSMQMIEARRAIELDNSLAEGHAELANAEINLNWDWAAGGAEFRRALQLSPRSASIHEEYESYLVRTGRVREALAEIQKSGDLDPFSSRLFHLEGSILYYCRQYDQALQLIQKVRTLDIPPPNWHFLLGEIYAEKGAFADSIAEFSRAGSRPQALSHLANAYARSGQVDVALAIIPRLEDTVKNEGIGRYEIALVYAGLGKKDEAFKWLEEAYKTHDNGLTYLKIEPCLAPLRSDPRFDDLLSRVGLSQ